MNGHIIGVDIGTSLTKAIVFDHTGVSIAEACTASEVHHLPGGLVEQDLEQVLGTVATVVRDVSGQLDGPVAALALTGQGDGLWLRDAEGAAVRPAISWLDGRANSLLAKWQAEGVTREVFRPHRIGSVPRQRRRNPVLLGQTRARIARPRRGGRLLRGRGATTAHR
jgi:erythritol kinase